MLNVALSAISQSGLQGDADENLLVGYNTLDDGAVYRLSPDLAIVNTLDFFPPMVDDPYIFGQIAAANALSDVWAMGGVPKLALNILAFPEKGDPNALAAILAGGASKVHEAKATICGGHSISDTSIKYGLSVTGVVHPDKIMKNNSPNIGDVIVLTKPLGVGIVTAAYSAGKAGDNGKSAYEEAIGIMTKLNGYAFDIAKKYNPTAITDVTGFGFLGHLNEMVNNHCAIKVYAHKLAYINEAYELAQNLIITSAGARNRRFLEDKIKFNNNVKKPLQEIMLDPQTSGGLLIAMNEADANEFVKEYKEANIVAQVIDKLDDNGVNIIIECEG